MFAPLLSNEATYYLIKYYSIISNLNKSKTLYFLASISGILISFLAGTYLDWRQLAYVGAGIPIPFIICMCLIPETPRWYVSKDKKKRGRKALQWLRGENTDVSTEFNEIEKSQESQLSENSVSFFELFSARYRKPLLISMGLMLFQQMSGINAIMFYMKDIFKVC